MNSDVLVVAAVAEPIIIAKSAKELTATTPAAVEFV